jgi:hypothetical protein
MGMFDKDKEVGLLLTSAFDQGEQFVMYDARIDREDFPTKFGPQPRAMMTVAKIVNGKPGPRFEVNTVASAIVSKVREAESDDFPAVVMWRKVPSDRSSSGEALVLQLVAAWGAAADNPPTAPMIPEGVAHDADAFAAAAGPLPSGPPQDDDIPF